MAYTGLRSMSTLRCPDAVGGRALRRVHRQDRIPSVFTPFAAIGDKCYTPKGVRACPRHNGLSTINRKYLLEGMLSTGSIPPTDHDDTIRVIACSAPAVR